MKYLAILKDSVREAIDSKVLYVMVGLSVLVTLFVLTLSFKPLSAETLVRNMMRGNMFAGMAENPHMEAAHRRAAEEMAREAAGAGQTRLSAQAAAVQGFAAPEVTSPLMAQAAVALGVAALDSSVLVKPGPFELASVELLKGAPDSPDSEYRVNIRKHYGSPAAAAAVRKAPTEELAALKERFAGFEQDELIKIGDVRLASPEDRAGAGKAPSPNDVLFEIVLQPTSATRRLWPHEPSLFFGAVPLGGSVPLGGLLFFVASVVVGIGSWVAILVSVIITAFFIPNMLRKGTVDLLLVKPIRRWALLVYKYVGGLTFIFFNTAVAILGIWLALGLRSGVWANRFLLMIFILTFFFAILYAVSTLFGVLTRSTIVAILMTCGAWFAFFLVGTLYLLFDQRAHVEEAMKLPPEQRWSQNTFGSIVRAVHFVVPRTSDLNQLGQQLVLGDFLTQKAAAKMNPSSITWGESLSVSGVFIALMLGIACWWFTTKDY
jgi:ABC-type transport system involved in multi-copper enzyme maturation permease subunit